MFLGRLKSVLPRHRPSSTSMTEPWRDRDRERTASERPHALTAETLRSYIHQLYGTSDGAGGGLDRAASEPHHTHHHRHHHHQNSAPQSLHASVALTDQHRSSREAVASTSRASRLSEQRQWPGRNRTSVTPSRQQSRESAPELLGGLITSSAASKKSKEEPLVLSVRNVARHDKRLARPVSSREKQQRIAGWLLQVDRALGERRRQLEQQQLPVHPLDAELGSSWQTLMAVEPRARQPDGQLDRRAPRRP